MLLRADRLVRRVLEEDALRGMRGLVAPAWRLAPGATDSPVGMASVRAPGRKVSVPGRVRACQDMGRATDAGKLRALLRA